MNDKLLARIRVAYQLAVGGLLGWLTKQGIDIPFEGLDAVLWPLVTFLYYVAAQEVTERVESSRLANVLLGPGPAPIYTNIPDGVLEAFLDGE